jgi:clan AA aspartic protease (TIGR02281 family)
MSNRPSVLVALLALGLWAAPAGAQWSASNQAEVPLDGSGQSWFVRATVNGTVRGLFLLDTGASFCVLAPATARRISTAASTTHVTLRTANGTVKAPVLRLSSVEIGGARARDVQAVVHDAVAPPLDGIIGLSFLNNFTYSVDPRRRVLRLR